MQQQGAPQWREVEIDFAGPNAANPYTDVDAWVIFTNDSGRQLRRPVFWDGGTQLPGSVCVYRTGREVAMDHFQQPA